MRPKPGCKVWEGGDEGNQRDQQQKGEIKGERHKKKENKKHPKHNMRRGNLNHGVHTDQKKTTHLLQGKDAKETGATRKEHTRRGGNQPARTKKTAGKKEGPNSRIRDVGGGKRQKRTGPVNTGWSQT